jgi:hypothetical protein
MKNAYPTRQYGDGTFLSKSGSYLPNHSQNLVFTPDASLESLDVLKAVSHYATALLVKIPKPQMLAVSPLSALLSLSLSSPVD